MTNLEALASHHGSKYEARLRHIDELIERADKGLAKKVRLLSLLMS